MPFVRFYLGRYDIHSTAVIRRGEVIEMPNKVMLYHVEFYNGVHLFVVERNGKLFIFDKEIEWRIDCNSIAFIVSESNVGSFTFNVAWVDDSESTPLATIKVAANGKVEYDGVPLKTRNSGGLYAKTKTLGVVSRNVIY